MPNENENNIAKDLATVFALNTAAYAGALVGVGVVYYAAVKISDKIRARKNK